MRHMTFQEKEKDIYEEICHNPNYSDLSSQVK